jgi:hypothetical protein
MKKGKSKTNSTAMQGVEERNAALDEDDTRDIMTGVNPFLNIPGFPALNMGQKKPGAQMTVQWCSFAKEKPAYITAHIQGTVFV